MATIKDVAKLAGVSTSTVSNILNNKDSVNVDLYHRVKDAMEQLHYSPNLLAMNLRYNKIYFVGVIISELAEHYCQILEGISRVANEQEWQLIVRLVKNDRYLEGQEVSNLAHLGVKGLISISSNLDAQLEQVYNETKLPVVFADHFLGDSRENIVKFDNASIVKELTKELAERYDSVCLVAGKRHLGSEEDCCTGYFDALSEIGRGMESRTIEVEINKELAFTRLLNSILDMESVPDCFIVSNMILARSLLEAASIAGAKAFPIYALSGDVWYDHSEERIICIKRNAINCGISAAKLMKNKMKYQQAFDNVQQTVINRLEPPLLQPTMPSEPTKQQETLKVLLLNSNMSKATIRLLPKFAAQTGIKVEYTCLDQSDMMGAILKNTDMQSDEYDVYMMCMHWLPLFTSRRALCRLNDYLSLEKALPQYIDKFRDEMMQHTDNLMALPMTMASQMLIYRNELFENTVLKKKFYSTYGLSLQIPRTWSEFNLIAGFFTRQHNPESPTQYGTCLLGSQPDGLIAEFLPRQWAYNGRMFDGNKISICSTANVNALNNLCESYKYSYPDCLSFLDDEQVSAFLNNNVAMSVIYNVHWKEQLGFGNEGVRYANPPGKASLIGGWTLGINTYSKHKEAAARFIEWTTCDEMAIQRSLLGQLVPKKIVQYDDEIRTVYPWLRRINEQLGQSQSKEVVIGNHGDIVANIELERILTREIKAAILQEKTVKEALLCVKKGFLEIV